jgi:hypothetical protein
LSWIYERELDTEQQTDVWQVMTEDIRDDQA